MSAAPDRLSEAEATVRRHALWALGIGALPLPLLDFVALTAVQVKLLRDLARLYGVAFPEPRARALVLALVTGLGSVVTTGAIAGSLLKLVPVVGALVGSLGVPLVAAALTRAIGGVFVLHFEAGGTLLTFDVEAMRMHFHRVYAAALADLRRQPDPQGPIPP